MTSKPDFKVMVLLLVFMQLTRDLFAIAKFLYINFGGMLNHLNLKKKLFLLADCGLLLGDPNLGIGLLKCVVSKPVTNGVLIIYVKRIQRLYQMS